MSSLWTPSGEHHVPRQQPGADAGQSSGTGQDRPAQPEEPERSSGADPADGSGHAAGTSDGPAAGTAQASGEPAEIDDETIAALLPEGTSVDDLSPEERSRVEAVVKEMAEARQRLLETPAATIVANHAMGLYELAALHLSQPEPDFAEATLAIDSLAALVDGVQDRLGDAGPTVQQALDQIRMAFVQVKNRPAG